MARPQKPRKICSMPLIQSFHPNIEPTGSINMTVDEYDIVLLLDYRQLTQEQCAKQIGVARPTVTLIYESARRKMAQALVEGKELVISGGNIFLCKNSEDCCGLCGKEDCSICTVEECNKKYDIGKKV